MKTGIYKCTLERGRGADVAVVGLAEELRRQGHEAAVFERGEFDARTVEAWDVMVAAGTVELLDLARAFPRSFSWPVVMQFHTNPQSQFKRKRWIRNWRIRRALRRCAAIQVLSERFAGQVSGYGVPVEVIGNWSAHAGKECGDGNAEEPLIIYPAAMDKKKNQRLLAEAFALVAEDFPEWRLEFYGKGEFEGELPPRTKLMGYRDLRETYGRCAILAFPSLDEGFGLAVADAAAFGRPAVLLQDWIGTVAAGGGILCRPDAESFAAGLRRLMGDAELRRRMGECARRHCAANYTKEKIIGKWESLLRRAASLR